MARCEGKTRNGDRCKREVRGDSKFCYLHDSVEDETPSEATAEEQDTVEWDDVLPVLLAGAATLGFVMLFKTLSRFIPKL